MNGVQMLHGMRFVTSPLMTVRGPDRRTTRAWRQRRRRGRSGIVVRMVPTAIPDPNGFMLEGNILAVHPATFERLKAALETKA